MACAIAASSITESSAQAVDASLWSTNGIVHTVACAGGTVYIGGEFTRVGPVTGGGAPLDLDSDALPPSAPRVSGIVYSVASDGAGGWFIGGNFTSVGGRPRHNLAHVAADLSVSDWDPGAYSVPGTPYHDASGVFGIAVSGSTVYVGGFFTRIGDTRRDYLAAVDATTGAVTAWDPDASDPVRVLAVADGVVYAGGYFTELGGQVRRGIGAIDAATGAVTGWDPNLYGDFPQVLTIAVSGTTVYVGGNFRNGAIGGQPRRCVAALDRTSGAALAWNPNPDDGVYAIAVRGSTVLVGGTFRQIGGQPRNHLAALDATTGAATGWNPNANGTVDALAVAGDTVIVGGRFIEIGGQARQYFATLDAITGEARDWNPVPNNWVRTVAISGSRVYAGGHFSTVGGVQRNFIAALDTTTGVATAWNPDADGPVLDLSVQGSLVYAGGSFHHIGGQTRRSIAAIAATSGLATAWDPNPTGVILTLTAEGSVVYAGGAFSSIGGEDRRNIAALDAATGRATSWDPNANHHVMALAVDGALVYAAGSFTAIGGQERSRLAALDATSGQATSWDPNPTISSLELAPLVCALATKGSHVYVGGYFDRIGGQSRRHLAALDALTGEATPWDAGVRGVDSERLISALAVTDSALYAVGEFTTIGGQARNYVAALDLTTGAATPWDPSADWVVEDVALSGSTVYVGGRFSYVGAMPANGLAAIRDPSLRVPVPPEEPPAAGRLLNFPNPFSTSTRFSFTLPVEARVTLEVFDLAGRLVSTLLRGERLAAGPQQVEFRHGELRSGVYLSRLTTDRDVVRGRMLVLQ